MEKNEKYNFEINDTGIINQNIKNRIYKSNNGTKSSTNLKENLNNFSKKNEKKDLYINTDFKNNSKNKLVNILNNKENIENDKNKNILNNNIKPKEEEFSLTKANDKKRK